MKNLKTYISLLCTIAVLSSCTTRVFDLTLVSTKNVPLSNSANFKTGESAYAQDQLHQISVGSIFLLVGLGPLGYLIPSVDIPDDFPTYIDPKEAVDMAIESIPGCVALKHASLTYERLPLLVYRSISYVIEGTAVIDPSLAAGAEPMPRYSKIEVDKDGNKHIQALSCDEYQELRSGIVKKGRKTKLSTRATARK